MSCDFSHPFTTTHNYRNSRKINFRLTNSSISLNEKYAVSSTVYASCPLSLFDRVPFVLVSKERYLFKCHFLPRVPLRFRPVCGSPHVIRSHNLLPFSWPIFLPWCFMKLGKWIFHFSFVILPRADTLSWCDV
jgi:hypothetical protein